MSNNKRFARRIPLRKNVTYTVETRKVIFDKAVTITVHQYTSHNVRSVIQAISPNISLKCESHFCACCTRYIY